MPATNGVSDRKRMIIIYGRHEASVGLYFDGLPADLLGRLRFVAPGPLALDAATLIQAALVVFVRGFERPSNRGLVAALRLARVPYVWFIDDDFRILGREVREMAYYSQTRVARFAASASAIVVTSGPLAKACADLNEHVIQWPCVRSGGELRGASRRDPQFRVGAFGGGFRRGSFVTHVAPALASMRSVHETELFVSAGLSGVCAATTVAPFRLDLAAFLGTWRRFALNAIVHPLGETANLSSKSPASLLVAGYLGAPPIVGDEPAYAGVGEAQGVLKADCNPASWGEALTRLADPDENASLYERLEAWIRQAFDPEAARAPFEQLAALGHCQ